MGRSCPVMSIGAANTSCGRAPSPNWDEFDPLPRCSAPRGRQTFNLPQMGDALRPGRRQARPEAPQLRSVRGSRRRATGSHNASEVNGCERPDDRPHRASDPAPAFRRRHEPDARGLGARLEPGYAPLPSGGRPERLARPDRRCGLREPERVRRSDRHAQLHPHGRGGAALQPLPRDRGLLARAGGHADREEPPPGRVRPRGRVLGPLSRATTPPFPATARRRRGSSRRTAT